MRPLLKSKRFFGLITSILILVLIFNFFYSDYLFQDKQYAIIAFAQSQSWSGPLSNYISSYMFYLYGDYYQYLRCPGDSTPYIFAIGTTISSVSIAIKPAAGSISNFLAYLYIYAPNGTLVQSQNKQFTGSTPGQCGIASTYPTATFQTNLVLDSQGLWKIVIDIRYATG